MQKIIITCEHGGNDIPEPYAQYFEMIQERLQSHEGWDLGALNLAQSFAPFAHETCFATVSRLLVDLNRSMGHPKLFSNITQALSESDRKKILEEYYNPYREKVISLISASLMKNKPVLHLSIHSFTPIFFGKERKVDLGFLFNPQRIEEKRFCETWKKLIQANSPPKYKVRFNYPYLGKADGLVTALRKQFSQKDYIGVEVEVNQALLQGQSFQPALSSLLVSTFQQLLVLTSKF